MSSIFFLSCVLLYHFFALSMTTGAHRGKRAIYFVPPILFFSVVWANLLGVSQAFRKAGTFAIGTENLAFLRVFCFLLSSACT